ncbi:hypothetical protein WMY93_000358 [Mugilogobius chulae]|uniref:C2 domain-containing protein n=1 Tax=Mugilogobius chulae TaxID=88201 RepID=A0AAW0Q989_9GOBI
MSTTTTPGPKMNATVNGPNPKPNGPLAPPPAPPLPEELDQGDPMASLTDVSQMWLRFGKTFLVILPIYILGYFEFSFSWVLVGLAALFYWKRNYSDQDYRINKALKFLDHEEKVTSRNVSATQLPPWTVKQMWPFICQFVDKLFRETIEPAVKNATPYLSTFCFTKIDLGDKPLRVNGVKVYTENVDKDSHETNIYILYIRTYVKSKPKETCCSLHGVMRVVMEPLLGDMPLIGALSVFSSRNRGLSDGLIGDILCQYLVLPNKISIPLVGEAQLAQLRFPVPKGVLRIHFLEAQELLGKDTFLGGLIKGKSDPYGVIQLGTELFKSKVIHETVNPSGTRSTSLMIDLAEVQKEQKVDEWFALEDVSQGKVHLKLEWLSLLSKPDKLDQVLSSIRADRGHANDGLSSALLVVFLDSARNLPTATVSKVLKSGKKVTSDPSPFVQFTVGHKSFNSKVRYKTNQPVWEEAFTFLIHNPKTQELEVEVRDEKHECSLGTLTVPLTSLLEAKDMTVNKNFTLRSTGPTCSVKMKIALRVLSLEEGKDAPSSSDSAPSSVQVRKSSSSSTPRPSISSDSGLKTPSQPPGVRSASVSAQDQGLNGGLQKKPFTQSNLSISGSQQLLPGGKEPTPSIASDISNPSAAQELQYRLSQLQNGSGPSQFPLGEIQLTIRHSSQRNKLIVVVLSCRNLIAFSDNLSDPYVRLYLLPDKRRSGRRKTHTQKKNLNPIFDQTFEFSVTLGELHKRTLDVAVKNGGGLLSKHKGLLGKVLIDLTQEDVSKSWTQCRGGGRLFPSLRAAAGASDPAHNPPRSPRSPLGHILLSPPLLLHPLSSAHIRPGSAPPLRPPPAAPPPPAPPPPPPWPCSFPGNSALTSRSSGSFGAARHGSPPPPPPAPAAAARSPRVRGQKIRLPVDTELCSHYEICVNDGMFGRCHRRPLQEQLFSFDVSPPVVQRFRLLLQKLSSRGLTWEDDVTQRILSKELSKLRKTPLRPQPGSGPGSDPDPGQVYRRRRAPPGGRSQALPLLQDVPVRSRRQRHTCDPPKALVQRTRGAAGARDPLSSVDERFIQSVLKNMGREHVDVDSLTQHDVDQLSAFIADALQVVDRDQGRVRDRDLSQDQSQDLNQDQEAPSEDKPRDEEPKEAEAAAQSTSSPTTQQERRADVQQQSVKDKPEGEQLLTKLLTFLDQSDSSRSSPKPGPGSDSAGGRAVGLENVQSRTVSVQKKDTQSVEELSEVLGWVKEVRPAPADLLYGESRGRPVQGQGESRGKQVQVPGESRGKQVQEPRGRPVQVPELQLDVRTNSRRPDQEQFGYVITDTDGLQTDEGLHLMEVLAHMSNIHMANFAELS